jgi:hypothetical protein
MYNAIGSTTMIRLVSWWNPRIVELIWFQIVAPLPLDQDKIMAVFGDALVVKVANASQMRNLLVQRCRILCETVSIMV